MTTISIAGTSVNFTITGHGPAMVLVHGTSIDAQANFGHLVERFGDQRQVVSVNYAGSGGSTIPDGDLALETLVEQIAAAIRRASDGPVDLVGDSLGAVVAAATAATYPELIRKLVLVAGWADSGDARHQMVFDTWAELEAANPEMGNRYVMSLGVKPAFLTAFGSENIAAFLHQAPPPHTNRRIRLGLRIAISDKLKNIAAPTSIIRGEHDYLIPPYQTEALHAGIQGSEMVVLDCGHAAFLEKPDELVTHIRQFLFA
jgi:pimeloyl-ACP methyl ester carboxylesterase